MSQIGYNSSFELDIKPGIPFFQCVVHFTVGDNAHTTGWTDASKDTPESIIKIVNGIKKIVSKEKIV